MTTSCQFFETEKIASETFYEEEMKTIDWKYVDQYPTVPSCENHTEKEAKKECFVYTLSDLIYTSLEARNIHVTKEINDTIYLDFSVHKNAILEVTKITMDSTTKQHLPSLKDWLLETVEVMKLDAPAYKRGIPVETKFTLPIVIQTGN